MALDEQDWTAFHAAQAVTAEQRADAEDSVLTGVLLEAAEDFARAQGAIEVNRQQGTVDWHQATEENIAALEAQVHGPLEIGDWVAHITLPARRGPTEPAVPEEVEVLVEAAGLAEEALRLARRVRIWPMTVDRISVHLAIRALEGATGDLKLSAEILAEAAVEHRPVKP